MRALSTRQERFVEHYALCGNAAEAARLAGYSPRTARVIGPENLLKPAVREAVEARQRALVQELMVTKEDLIVGILSAIQMAREQRNPGVMIGGLVQIAKLCGFFEPTVSRVELSGNGEQLKAQFAQMPDEELSSIATGSVPLQRLAGISG